MHLIPTFTALIIALDVVETQRRVMTPKTAREDKESFLEKVGLLELKFFESPTF